MKLQTLRIVKPVPVTGAMMIDSNVPENDYPVYASGVTYGQNDRVIKNHSIWESTAVGNVGNDPEGASGKWERVGATNRYKAYDNSVSSQTKNSTSITYHLRPGVAITSVNALNMTGASSFRVRVVDPYYGEIENRLVDMASTPLATGWWNWKFGQRRVRKQALLTGLKSTTAADIYIEIQGTTALAVGVILIGQMQEFTLGVSLGARLGIQDYSRKERNQFGDVVLMERAFAKRASFSMLLDNSELDAFNDFLTSVRATACLWIGSDAYECTTIYGFYKQFEMLLSYPEHSDCELDLEGLT